MSFSKSLKVEFGVTSKKKKKSQNIPQIRKRNEPSIIIAVKNQVSLMSGIGGDSFIFVILCDTLKLVINFVTRTSSSLSYQIQLALEKITHQDLNYLLTRMNW